MRDGAVTFLDVLGWKGIWTRDKPDDAVRRLRELLDLAENVASVQDLGQGDQRGRTTEVKSISDTIVLQTVGDPDVVLRVHAEICKELVPRSIERELPLRGATAYGTFLPRTEGSDTIVIGPAVDEAASWHEATDWIGVMLTPSAVLSIDAASAEARGWVAYKKVPLKKGQLDGLRCVDWTKAWKGSEGDLTKAFRQMGPLVVGVAPKYLHTLDFYRERSEKREAASVSRQLNSDPKGL